MHIPFLAPKGMRSHVLITFVICNPPISLPTNNFYNCSEPWVCVSPLYRFEGTPYSCQQCYQRQYVHLLWQCCPSLSWWLSICVFSSAINILFLHPSESFRLYCFSCLITWQSDEAVPKIMEIFDVPLWFAAAFVFGVHHDPLQSLSSRQETLCKGFSYLQTAQLY